MSTSIVQSRARPAPVIVPSPNVQFRHSGASPGINDALRTPYPEPSASRSHVSYTPNMAESMYQPMELNAVRAVRSDSTTIRKGSVMVLLEPDTKENAGDLSHPRMSAVDKTLCYTCNGDTLQCKGHYGHLELYESVLYPHFASFANTMLQVHCLHCGADMVDTLVTGPEYDAAFGFDCSRPLLMSVLLHEAPALYDILVELGYTTTDPTPESVAAVSSRRQKCEQKISQIAEPQAATINLHRQHSDGTNAGSNGVTTPFQSNNNSNSNRTRSSNNEHKRNQVRAELLELNRQLGLILQPVELCVTNLIHASLDAEHELYVAKKNFAASMRKLQWCYSHTEQNSPEINQSIDQQTAAREHEQYAQHRFERFAAMVSLLRSYIAGKAGVLMNTMNAHDVGADGVDLDVHEQVDASHSAHRSQRGKKKSRQEQRSLVPGSEEWCAYARQLHSLHTWYMGRFTGATAAPCNQQRHKQVKHFREQMQKIQSCTYNTVYCSAVLGGCGAPIPKLFNKGTTFHYEYPNSMGRTAPIWHMTRTPYMPHYIRSVLESQWWASHSMLHRTARLIAKHAIDQPDTFWLDVLPVIPPLSRPTASYVHGRHALTGLYSNIMQINRTLLSSLIQMKGLDTETHLVPGNGMFPVNSKLLLSSQFSLLPCMGQIHTLRTHDSKCRAYLNNVQRLQEAVNSLISIVPCSSTPYENNKNFNFRRQNARPPPGFKASIDTKEGMIRRDIIGRVLLSTYRSVATCNPNIRQDEASLGEKTMRQISVRHAVTPYNRRLINAELETMVPLHTQLRQRTQSVIYNNHLGHRIPLDRIVDLHPELIYGVYPAITSIDPVSHRTQTTSTLETRVVARPGDVVEQKLKNGMLFIANRQPTLTGYGIQAYRVVGASESKHTLGMHPSNTGQFNLDHDGDVMTYVTVQDMYSMAEAEVLMSAQACARDFQTASNTAGMIQSCLDGVFRSMLRHISLRPDQAHAILKTTIKYQNRDASTLLSNKTWTMYDMVQWLLPVNSSYSRGNPANGLVQHVHLNRDPSISTGALTKKDLGTGHNTLFKQIAEQYGADVMLNLMMDLVRVSVAVNELFQQSFGLDDSVLHYAVYAHTQMKLRHVSMRQNEQAGQAQTVLLHPLVQQYNTLEHTQYGSALATLSLRRQRADINNQIEKQMIQQVIVRDKTSGNAVSRALQQRLISVRDHFGYSYAHSAVSRLGKDVTNTRYETTNKQDIGVVHADPLYVQFHPGQRIGRYGMPVAGDGMALMVFGGSKGKINNAQDCSLEMGLQAPDGKLVGNSLSGRFSAYSSWQPGAVDLRGYVSSNLTRGITVSQACAIAPLASLRMAQSGDKVAGVGTESIRTNAAFNPIQIVGDHSVRYGPHKILMMVYGDDGTDCSYARNVRFPLDENLISSVQVRAALRTRALDKLYACVQQHPDIQWTSQQLQQHLTIWRARVASGHLPSIYQIEMEAIYNEQRVLSRCFMDRRYSLTRSGRCHAQQCENWLCFINVPETVDVLISAGLPEQLHARHMPPHLRPWLEQLEHDQSTMYDTPVLPTQVIAAVDCMVAFIHRYYRLAQDNLGASRPPLCKVEWYLREQLHSKRVIDHYRLTVAKFAGLILAIISRFLQTRAIPNDAVGIKASLAEGEALVQVQLDLHANLHASSLSKRIRIERMTEIHQLQRRSHNIMMYVPLHADAVQQAYLPGELKSSRHWGSYSQAELMANLTPPPLHHVVTEAYIINDVACDAAQYCSAVCPLTGTKPCRLSWMDPASSSGWALDENCFADDRLLIQFRPQISMKLVVSISQCQIHGLDPVGYLRQIRLLLPVASIATDAISTADHVIVYFYLLSTTEILQRLQVNSAVPLTNGDGNTVPHNRSYGIKKRKTRRASARSKSGRALTPWETNRVSQKQIIIPSNHLFLEHAVLSAAKQCLPHTAVQSVELEEIESDKSKTHNLTLPEQKLLTLHLAASVTERNDRAIRSILSRPDVDYRRCLPSDPDTAFRLFGVGASRRVIEEENTKVLGSVRNMDPIRGMHPTHGRIKSSWMTARGRPTQINKAGIESMAQDFIHLAAYEASFARLSLAAVRSETSKLHSFTSAFWHGSAAKSGVHGTRMTMEYQPEQELQQELSVVTKEMEERRKHLCSIIQNDLGQRLQHDSRFHVFT